MEVKSDIEIAQATELEPITTVAEKAGIDPKSLWPIGNAMAKIDLSAVTELADKPNGKLILTTAITPTPW